MAKKTTKSPGRPKKAAPTKSKATQKAVAEKDLPAKQPETPSDIQIDEDKGPVVVPPGMLNDVEEKEDAVAELVAKSNDLGGEKEETTDQEFPTLSEDTPPTKEDADQEVESPDATDHNEESWVYKPTSQSQSDVLSIIGQSLQLAIDNLPTDERGKLSDGYHTFDELYEHRCLLFAKLCDVMTRSGYPHNIWRSKLNSHGVANEGWFILGISKHPGKQITYHLPEKLWDECKFAKTLDRAPEYDGHTSADVLERIKNL